MLTSVRRLFRHLMRHRSTRVTTEGTRFLFFTFAVAVAAINTGNNLFYLLLAMMLSIILMSGIMAEACLRRLEFHRHLPDLVYAGEPVTATVVVANRKSRLPSFSLHLWDVTGEQDIDRGLTLWQLMPGASQILSYPLIATRRGRLRFDGVRVGTSFPFGLFHKKAYYPLDASVVVAPVIRPVESTFLQNLAVLGQDLSLPRKGHGSDLYNLRQYHAGDDSRTIHWLSTARTSKLMVRETEAEISGVSRSCFHFSPHLAMSGCLRKPSHLPRRWRRILRQRDIRSDWLSEGCHLRLAKVMSISYGSWKLWRSVNDGVPMDQRVSRPLMMLRMILKGEPLFCSHRGGSRGSSSTAFTPMAL